MSLTTGGPQPPRRAGAGPPVPAWRLRIVDEPLRARQVGFDADASPGTPVLDRDGRSLRQVSGPVVSVPLLAEVRRQVMLVGLGHRRWGAAAARTGPAVDLVADRSALRLHTVDDGFLHLAHDGAVR